MKYLIAFAASAAALLPLSVFADATTTPTGTVTIAAYVAGQHATAENMGSLSIPMISYWSAKNIGIGNGTYSLGTSGFNTATPYEAVTSDMSTPYNYATRAGLSFVKDNGDGANISKNCQTRDPFTLDGYSVGDSLASAEAAGPTIEPWDAVHHSSTNQFMIVWVHHCLTAPTITAPKNGSKFTQSQMTHVDWSPVTDPWGTVSYIYQSAVLTGSGPAPTNPDGSFVTPAYTSSPLATTTIATPGTPPGTYYIHVKAVDENGSSSWWSNPIKVKVIGELSPS